MRFHGSIDKFNHYLDSVKDKSSCLALLFFGEFPSPTFEIKSGELVLIF